MQGAFGFRKRSGMIVRKAIPGDEMAIGRIHVEGWQFSYRDIYSDEFLAAMSVQEKIDMWRGLIRDNPEERSIFVCESNGKVAGFLSVCPFRMENAKPDQGEISAVYVDPALQGKGVGAALVKHALDWYHARPIKEVFVQTLDKSKYKHFYPKQGGVAQPIKVTRSFKDGQTLEMITYKWEL
jgi:GNAT superfamily N-acetyltransferase